MIAPPFSMRNSLQLRPTGRIGHANDNNIMSMSMTMARHRRNYFSTPTALASNFFDDDPSESGEDTSSSSTSSSNNDTNTAPRPRATSSSNNQEYQRQQQQQQPPDSTANNNDIMSTRALYQFRPLPAGSSRPMPPTISDYGFHDYDDDDGDANGAMTTGDSDDNNNNSRDMGDEGDVTNYDQNLDMDDNVNFFDQVEDTPMNRSAKVVSKPKMIQQQQKESPSEEPMEYNKSMTSNNNNDSGTNAKSTTPLPKQSTTTPPKPPMASNNDAPSYPNPMPRARAIVTPSFMEPEKTKAMIQSNNNNNDDSVRKIPSEASSGTSSTTHLTTLTHQLEHLTAQIYQLNDGGIDKFNINSPKQVARVLFGEDNTGDTSTNKDVLEAMASAGNEMAAYIYKFRKLSREVKREERRIEQLEKGDVKNDYYGNLARLDERKRQESSGSGSGIGTSSGESTNGATPEIDDAKTNDETAATTTTTSQQTPTTDQQTTAEPANTNISRNRKREPLLLIDASAYIFRSYHAIPPLHHSDGTPTGALHGVCRMLQNLLLTRLLRGDRPRVVLAFDFKGPNFRHEVYPEYKANRGPCPEDLVPQFDLVRQAADAFGVVQVEAKGYEADDVIATLAKQAVDEGVDVDIFSGDKDLMQLITPVGVEPSVHMITPTHFDRMDHDDVVSKWGVSSEKLGDVLALAGDSADNIPGAPGIGPKIAATLINEYGTLSALIEQAENIKQNKRRESIIENAEKLLLCRTLVALDDSIPNNKMTLPASFQGMSTLKMTTFDPNKLIEFYKRMELNACQNQLETRLRSSWVNYKPPPSPESYEGVPF